MLFSNLSFAIVFYVRKENCLNSLWRYVVKMWIRLQLWSPHTPHSRTFLKDASDLLTMFPRILSAVRRITKIKHFPGSEGLYKYRNKKSIGLSALSE